MMKDKLWVNVLCIIAVLIMYVPLVVWFVDLLAE
jgi:hypothetical protein